MFKAIRAALRSLLSIEIRLSDLITATNTVSESLQEPTALRAYVDRLEALEARQAQIVDEASEILKSARTERLGARSAEERTKTRERNIIEAAEALDSYEESEDQEPEYADLLSEGDGEGSPENGMLHVRSRLEARADAKARARAHKYK